jgi:POT family proton-dependent oligopeptide transporter
MAQMDDTVNDYCRSIHKDTPELLAGASPAVNKSEEPSPRSHEDSFPNAVWLVMLLATAERFSFYGMTAPFMNYMQNNRDDQLHKGVMGWGQGRASQISNVFFILTLLTPLAASLVADKNLGRFRVLCITFAIYLLGSILLFVSSLKATASGAAPLFILALVFIAVGMSGVNGLLAAFVGDQYTTKEGAIVTTRRGKRIIVDRGRTIESIYNMYYWCINVGGLAGLATTELELHVGFWAAFLLPVCALSISAAVLYLGHSRLTIVPAQKVALLDAMSAMWLAMRGRFSLDHAKPAYQALHNHNVVPWTDDFVEEIKTALAACRMMFMAWPILWLCRGQISTNLVSQAAQMRTSGVPNDMMYNVNPIVIILVLPLVDGFILPRLRRSGLPMTAVTRLTVGFFLEALAMGMAAVVQKLIYNAGPCYSYPLQCATAADGTVPNDVSVFVQLPIYVVEALSEILSSPAGYEMAFTMAPGSMKSLLQAAFSATGATGAVLSIIISPTYKNPYLVWVYTSLAAAMGLVTLLFCLIWGRREAGKPK